MFRSQQVGDISHAMIMHSWVCRVSYFFCFFNCIVGVGMGSISVGIGLVGNCS